MKKHITIVLTAFMIFGYSSFVVADGNPVKYPDVNYTNGEINLTIKNTDGGLIKGVSLSIYKVADVINNDNDYSYKKRPEFDAFVDTANHNSFDSWLLNMDDAYSNDFAILLSDFVNVNNVSPIVTATSNDYGEMIFDNLTLGLYLLVDKHTNNTYYPTKSFLVSVPSKDVDVDPLTQEENITYYYSVNGTPKMELLEEAPPPINPPNQPNPPKRDDEIPDTSIPWGNVYLFGTIGVASIIIGIIFIRKSEHA